MGMAPTSNLVPKPKKRLEEGAIPALAIARKRPFIPAPLCLYPFPVSTPVTYRHELLDRYRLLYDWLPDSGPVLDVGCGNGIYTQWLGQKCGPAVGIDHNQANLEWAKAEFPACEFVYSNGENLPFADASFGAVMLTEVLEHTRDDRATLREIARVTRPGGTLALSTPHRGLFAGLDPDNRLNSLLHSVSKLGVPKPGRRQVLSGFQVRLASPLHPRPTPPFAGPQLAHRRGLLWRPVALSVALRHRKRLRCREQQAQLLARFSDATPRARLGLRY